MTPDEIMRGMIGTGYLPAHVELNNFVQVVGHQKEQQATDKVAALVDQPTIQNQDVPVPLTREEADAVQAKIQQLRDRILGLKGSLQQIEAQIAQQASPQDGKELSFRVDLKGRATLKRAVRRAFGGDFEDITYSMYKDAIALKRQIEQQEGSDYVKGK